MVPAINYLAVLAALIASMVIGAVFYHRAVLGRTWMRLVGHSDDTVQGGSPLAYPIVELGMGRVLEENMGGMFPYFRIEISTMVAAVFLAVGLSTLAAVLPAYQASKLSVTDALRRVA